MSEKTITQYLSEDAVRDNIEQTLGARAPQFVASVSALVNNNKALVDVDRKSLLAACLTAAALDLPINASLGFAHIIPYKNNRTGETLAQFQAGWKAFVQLAQRSGQYKTINTTDVREGELLGKNRLTGEIDFNWMSDEAEREKAAVVGYVAYFRLHNGFEKTLYMTKDELTKHAGRYSQAYKANRPGMNMWKDDFDAMARKTVLKLLVSKFGPMTTQMQQITLADQADLKDGYHYVDNQPVDANGVAKDKEYKRILDHIVNCQTVEDLGLVADKVDEYGLRTQYDDKFNLLGKK